MSGFVPQVVLGNLTIRTLKVGNPRQAAVVVPGAFDEQRQARFAASKQQGAVSATDPAGLPVPGLPDAFVELAAQVEDDAQRRGRRVIRRFRDGNGNGVMLVATDLSLLLGGRESGVIETLSCLTSGGTSSRPYAVVWQGVTLGSPTEPRGTGLVQVVWEYRGTCYELAAPSQLLSELASIPERYPSG